MEIKRKFSGYPALIMAMHAEGIGPKKIARIINATMTFDSIYWTKAQVERVIYTNKVGI